MAKNDPKSAILKKLTHGITGPVSTDIERMIVQFDKLTAIRRERPFTEAEQLIYDSLKHHVGAQFNAVIKRMQQGMKNGASTSKNQGNKGQGGGGGDWQTGSVQSFWVPIQAIINFVTSLFTTTDSDKPPFNLINLLKLIGVELSDTETRGAEYVGKVESLTTELQNSIEKLRDSVVTGISGAANASMDMVLNAFSLMPGIGTTLLIWRMFQNVLVILGSSLNVQAGIVGAGTGVAATVAAAGGAAAGAAIPVSAKVIGGGMKNKNSNNSNNRISITAGARVLHQSLKRFSGMAARMSSALMTTNSKSNSKTKRVRQWHNMSAYAMKPTFLPVLQLHRPHPILKPVAAA